VIGSKLSHGGAAIVALMLAGCSVAPAGVEIHDPYEQANRAIHGFNKDVDSALLRPAGQLAAHLPEAIRVPVTNFSDNAGLPGTVLNNLLQGDIGGAATNTMRFILNTTIGVLGLADPASAVGLHEVKTDFGATLAVWGVPEGAYVELPVLGPSTERDALGSVVDLIVNPFDWMNPDMAAVGILDTWDRPAWVAEQVIDRGVFGGTVDSVLHESADSYAQMRLLYLQNRRFELGQTGQGGHVDPYADAAAAPYAGSLYIDPYAEADQ